MTESSSPPQALHASLAGDTPDRLAVCTSVACAIHCALMPLLLPLLPYVVGGMVGEGAEHVFRGTALVLGVLSLGHSYRAVHRRWAPMLLFLAGITFLFAAPLVGRDTRWELLLVLVGAAGIVSAHVYNLRLRKGARRAGACACACHDT